MFPALLVDDQGAVDLSELAVTKASLSKQFSRALMMD